MNMPKNQVFPRKGGAGLERRRYADAMPSYRPMPLHLATERLTLRPWALSDADALRALHTERGNGTPTIERTRELITTLIAKTEQTGISLPPIRLRDTDDLIGYCGLIIGRSTLEEPELAYELFRHAHSHGYATEAAHAICTAATTTDRTRLWSTVRTWNAPSFRVLEKLGFTRDHLSTDEGGEIVWLTRALP